MRGPQFLLIVAVGCLFALTGLRQFFIEPLANTGTNVIWFVLQTLPLLLVLPGCLTLGRRGVFFASMVSLLYFVHGVMVFTESPFLAGSEIVVSIAMFGLASILLRALVRNQG